MMLQFLADFWPMMLTYLVLTTGLIMTVRAIMDPFMRMAKALERIANTLEPDEVKRRPSSIPH